MKKRSRLQMIYTMPYWDSDPGWFDSDEDPLPQPPPVKLNMPTLNIPHILPTSSKGPEANLSQAKFNETKFSEANLSGKNEESLPHSNRFHEAKFNEEKFIEEQLKEAKFEEQKLNEANLSGKNKESLPHGNRFQVNFDEATCTNKPHRNKIEVNSKNGNEANLPHSNRIEAHYRNGSPLSRFEALHNTSGSRSGSEVKWRDLPQSNMIGAGNETWTPSHIVTPREASYHSIPPYTTTPTGAGHPNNGAR